MGAAKRARLRVRREVAAAALRAGRPAPPVVRRAARGPAGREGPIPAARGPAAAVAAAASACHVCRRPFGAGDKRVVNACPCCGWADWRVLCLLCARFDCE